MAKKNCWEVMKCGKEEECPAARIGRGIGTHDGKNRGRFCWTVHDTLCMDKAHGSFAEKIRICVNQCKFYKQVKSEEGTNFILQ
ncbi:MAG: hypothetical protein JW984_07720 [Deltaproteobacteria bacterium]|uniref:Uncharacterized protein n=1 Tax=Candidatus Zymogenus saltonus TaxID=2844893 RepID=A0A9D8KDP6_9DELT|nr:hypothetical protein [Candidatus Zymogenus saltonus]